MLLTNDKSGLSFNYDTGKFSIDVNYGLLAKYLKGVYHSRDEFINDFVNYFSTGDTMYGTNWRGIFVPLTSYYDALDKITYQEAFELEHDEFRALVFGSIDVSEMIKELGSKLIKVEGKPVKHKMWDKEGKNWHWEEYDVVYELHHVNCSALGVNEELPVIKCWCTSTNKEHWLWVDEKFKGGSPLEAIASTCVVYENMLPHITSIKRHGDVFLFEMDKDIKPEGNLVPLKAEQYFRLLIAQS